MLGRSPTSGPASLAANYRGSAKALRIELEDALVYANGQAAAAGAAVGRRLASARGEFPPGALLALLEADRHVSERAIARRVGAREDARELRALTAQRRLGEATGWTAWYGRFDGSPRAGTWRARTAGTSPSGGCYFMSAPRCKGASAAGGAFFLIGSSCSSRLVDDPAIRLTPDFAELCRHGTKPRDHCPGCLGRLPGVD